MLDTHIWLWWLLGDGNLSSQEMKGLDIKASKQELSISWVTIWETEMLERKQRISLQPNFQTWIREATNPLFISILPVDIDVVLAQRNLPTDFPADPADRLITATSLLAKYPLATHDRRILESQPCEIWEV
ncbi:type II toxin-antitoxin system VapC family toxin [Rhodohalobacter sulfatireducens]|uniref:Type II toxin-antitoxin system VapC family toxin n=1 Tax=Rhodohalobacter sulfatireducens TaxID=2911366 RepID=A0ABS9KB69_9BACT|nr:type II toxin-antitoxin system VapC family toxin [Rhodohalobacter sulfatireducens]MCG2588102.1 type II toxin-antitoxin system VapC family toxin [Rhodohalobacter sulfatireducens]